MNRTAADVVEVTPLIGAPDESRAWDLALKYGPKARELQVLARDRDKYEWTVGVRETPGYVTSTHMGIVDDPWQVVIMKKKRHT